MPISATGISTASARGFTLLEVLVTLLLVGILTSLAVLMVGGDGGEGRLRDEARRLAAMIDLHHTEALLRGEQRGVQFSPEGYRFLTLGHDNLWLPPVTAQVGDDRQLPEDLHLDLSVEGRPVDLDADDAPEIPQVLLLSSGESTEFNAVLADDQRRGFQVVGDLLGRREVMAIP